MKKIFILVLITLFLTPFISANKVSAIGVSNFDFGNLSPRFQYRQDSSGDLINFEFEFTDTFDIGYGDVIPDLNIRLDQVDSNGNYIKNLEIFDVEYDVIASDIRGDVLNNISSRPAGYDEIFDMSASIVFRDVISIDSVYIDSVRIDESEWYIDGTDVIVYDLFISAGSDVDIYYKYQNTKDYVAEIEYDWSGLDFTLSNVAFYRLKYDNLVVFTGAVMKAPRTTMTTETTNYGVEVGDFFVEGDGTPNFSNQSSFTYNIYDDYLILHYNAPDLNPQLTENEVFRFIDIESNTVEESFTLEEVFTYQGGGLGVFTDSFIPLSLDGVMLPALETDYDHVNEPYISTTFTTGSYLPVMTYAPNSFSLVDYASTVINIVDTDKVPFELNLLNDTNPLNIVQRVTFRVNHDNISTAYETTVAKDNGLNVDHSDILNLTPYTYSIGYKPLDTLIDEDVVGVQWQLTPAFLPYSIDTSEFTITMSDSYIIDEGVIDVETDINTLLVYYGVGTELGQTFVAIFLVLLANVGLALMLKVRGFIVYAIINSVMLLLASVLGFVPVWFLFGVGILIIISMLIGVQSTRGDEV